MSHDECAVAMHMQGIYQSTAQTFSSASSDFLNFPLFNSCLKYCRILNNRVSAAKMKVQEANYIQNLQSRADALKMECSSLSTQVQSQQVCSVRV